MINATEISGIIPEGGSLVLNITKTKDGKLAVVVDPKGLSTSKDVVISPKVVTGTADELDKDFMTFLKKAGEGIASFDAAMKSLADETAKKLEEAKKDGGKKVEQAKKTAAVARKPAAKPISTASPAKPAVLTTGEEDREAEEQAEIEEAEETAGGAEGSEVKAEEKKEEVKAPAELTLF